MPFITDESVECIKVIADSNRCDICDSIGKERLRYQCGHGVCVECVAKVEHCLLCLTPPDTGPHSPHFDEPAARRANNALKLLNAFQETFNINVYRRSRLSGQLMLEKEVFPECIQAPYKYCNKRKTSILQTDKENTKPSTFPGEIVSPIKTVKMENTHKYVQNWLENSEKRLTNTSPRKPFADLNVNSPNTRKRGIPNRESLKNVPIKKKRKPSFKSTLAIRESQSLLNKYLKPVVEKGDDFKKFNKDFELCSNVTKAKNKTDKDESGIFIDEDLIVISDSQSQIIDKDQLALQAVVEANKRSPYNSQSLEVDRSQFPKISCDVITSRSDERNQRSSSNNVPFYKRSYLIETCCLCKADKPVTTKETKQMANQTKDVSITIENSSFLTSIKVSCMKRNPVPQKLSTPTQTNSFNSDGEINEPLLEKQTQEKYLDQIKVSSLENVKGLPSQNLFTAEIEEDNSKLLPKVINNVIIDSDSDDAANESSVIQVTAEVHRSSDQFVDGVLTEIEQSESQQRVKRGTRGCTPNSTDSSEKENCDPNRIKKNRCDKKYMKKIKILHTK